MRLLLVEDDAALVDDLRPVLKRAGYAVEVSDNGIDAAFLGSEENYDLIILDLGLPGKTGLEVLREWRARGVATPVLILTARDAWHERVDGLKAGADDYVGKPFHGAELLARLEAILRRGAGKASNSLAASGVTLDIDSQRATGPDGRVHPLTGVEFRLLRCFMTYPERILSKTELSEHIYAEEDLKDSNVIEVYINRLRRRFGHHFIETRRGQGYRLSRASE